MCEAGNLWRAATDNRKLNRVYTIRVEARDSVGNVTKGQTTVTIVADRTNPKRKSLPVAQGSD